VNDINFHPVHGTLVTAGSDSVYTYWDIDVHAKLKSSDQHDQAITKCCFNLNGQIFAYSIGYDWSKVSIL
jgi:mRNA export factor